MAKVNFENLPQDNGQGGGYSNSQVSFLNVADGEEVIVRIICDTTDDFDIHTVHNVEMAGYQYGRRMNCLRQPHEPMDMCPLCAAGKKIQQKMFIRLIQYVPDNTGRIIPQAKVWERSVNDRNFGARALKGYIDNYGPLSEMVCKIIRRGSGLNTEYQFIPNLNPQVYRPELYVKDTSLFGDYSPLGSAILNKTAEEYSIFLTTGQFPQTQNVQGDNVGSASSYAPVNNYQPANVTPRYTQPAATVPMNGAVTAGASDPNYNPSVTHYDPSTPSTPTAQPNAVAPRQNRPWENPTPAGNVGGFERPRRY